MFPKKKKKSPVIPIPRRPGQSLAEQWQDLIDDRLVMIVFGPAMVWAMVIAAWIQATSPFSLRLWVSVAIVITGFAAISCLRLIPQARRLIRGERGERVVAEQLEELRAACFRCFHDIVCDGFNIDHVLVGPPGVFVVETKFRSGSGLIEFRNGQGIFVGGREEECDCLKQARGNAREIHYLVRREANFKLPWVAAVVVFVGDWKIKNAWRDTDVRVLTVDQIKNHFVNQDQPALKRHEIDLICSHLKRTATEG